MDPEKLKAALDQLVKDPSLEMRPDGTTFCNVGLQRVAALFDYQGFLQDGELVHASEMIDRILADKENWITVEGKQAADFAQRGGFAVAFMRVYLEDEEGKVTSIRAPHDHVAAVYPAPMQPSGSLSRFVPLVANVGKKNAVMKSSEAFPVAQGESRYAIRV